MAAVIKSTQIDPNDGIALRTYLESLRGWLSSDRSSWDAQWADLSAFFEPYGSRFTYSDVNQGRRKDLMIINETGLLAKRTLAAGMLNGMSPPTRPWFHLKASDDTLDQQVPVRQWCEAVDQQIRGVFLKSNVYQTLLTAYGEEGLYGTSAFFLMEDPDTVIRCYPQPIGSYYLGVNDTLRQDLFMRIEMMTVRQLVDRFGYDNCSEATQVLYNSPAGGVKENRYPVVYCVMSGNYFGPNGIKPPMPWISTYYEMGNYSKKGILRRSGFHENPIICGRWKVTGENIYGNSPGMDCLGSTMSLQAWEDRIAQAAEKQFNPPMIASSDIDARRLTTLPGDISFVDARDVSGVFKPAYQFDFRLEGGLQQIQRIEGRINDAMYRSLFQMFSESDRRDITAEEIRARQQEKMQVLGPVVERNIEEMLSPLVKRTFAIMHRKGMIPPLPEALKDVKIKIEFDSILAQAQKIGTITNLTQFIQFVGGQVAVSPEIMDVVNTDEVVRKFADLASTPSKILRTPEEVQSIRAGRQQQQAMAQAAENAQKLAAAGKNMADSPLDQGTLLDAALPELSRIAQ